MPTVEPEMIYLSDILLPRDPTKANHAATKQYVDTQVTTLAPLTHTHVVAEITGLGTAATVNTGLAEGNIPVLGANGKLSNVTLPALAITNTFVVATENDMLALAAEEGDVAIRTDLNKSFILAGDDPTTLSDWQELLTPTDAVASVNGRTGTVTITLAELGGVATTSVGAANGVASLDANGLVPFTELPTESVLTDSATLIPASAAVYAHVSATNAHSATAIPTADRIAMYGSGGLLSSGTPTASAHVATKGYVDDLAASSRYRTTFSGDGTATEFEIIHNLNSSEVEVQVYHTVTVSPVTNYTNYVISGGIVNYTTNNAKATVTLPSGTVVEVPLESEPSVITNGRFHWSGTVTNVEDAVYDTVLFSCEADGGSPASWAPTTNTDQVVCTLSNSQSPKTTPVQVAFSPTTTNKIILSFATAPGTADHGQGYIVIVRK